MKTYYSIVSIAPKSYLNEKFNVGLLCVTPNAVFFHFSRAKFKIVSKLLSESGLKLAQSALTGISQQVDILNSENQLLFKEKDLSVVSNSYLNYLSRYNNNLVQFSQPTEIDLNIDLDIFKSLFRKFIYSSEVFESFESVNVSPFIKTKKDWLQTAKKYANVHFSVTSSIISDLIVPVTVDVFGKNGSFVSSQMIDFKKAQHHLSNEISSLLYLVEKTKKIDSESKSFIVGDEPIKSEVVNHQIWSDLRASNLVEMVSVDESAKVIDYLHIKGVAPLKV